MEAVLRARPASSAQTIREVISRSSAGREAVTEAARWIRNSSWVIVQAARGRGEGAPALQIPESMRGLTTMIVGTWLFGVQSAP